MEPHWGLSETVLSLSSWMRSSPGRPLSPSSDERKSEKWSMIADGDDLLVCCLSGLSGSVCSFVWSFDVKLVPSAITLIIIYWDGQ